MRYLFAIALGPVQDFIASARKTRDLWFGSKMLCELSRAAAQALKESGAILIFPPLEALDDLELSVANKILAIADTDSPSELVCAAKQAAQGILDGYWSELLSTSELRLSPDQMQSGNCQIREFLEFYAAWWPYPEGADYAGVRDLVERLLAGRKALRGFAQPQSRPGVPKSSLDGGRDAILNTGSLSPRDLARLGMKKGEILDAISLIKRLSGKARFVSISRIASDPVIRRLDSATLSSLIGIAEELEGSDLAQRFDGDRFPGYSAFPYDTQLVFADDSGEEGLTEEKRHLAVLFRETIHEGCRAAGIRKPYPYFAVLAADGDRMGALIGSLQTPEAHLKLSRSLGEFSRLARDIVLNNQGVMVYSGGDDVLAFLPLDTAIHCACALQKAFRNALSDLRADSIEPTLSSGICIAHYGEHLRHLLQWARNAESAAKRKGRNRLAVHLHTRTAGEDYVESVRCWDEFSGMTLEDYWKEITGLLANDQLPDGAVYELRSLVKEFSYPNMDTEVLRKEAERILQRKRTQGEGPVSQELLSLLARRSGKTPEELEHLVDELIIARRIAMGYPDKEVTP